jgi:RNA polymerase sigma-70 factor (ECF subfamily)
VRNVIEAWYREHGAALLLYATALSGDRPRAQDALHRVFLKLLEARSLAHVGDPKPYLFTAVRHTLLNDVRHQTRLAPLLEEAWFHPPHAEEIALRSALAALPADQREVVVLHVWAGLTFAQAAEVAGISANTAASRYRYAPKNCANSRRRSLMPADEFESYLRSFTPLAAAFCLWIIRLPEIPAPPPEHLTAGAASELLRQSAPWSRALEANAFAKPGGPPGPLEQLNGKERP